MATMWMRSVATALAVGAYLVSVYVGHASGSGEPDSRQAAPKDAVASVSQRLIGERLVIATKRHGVKSIAGVSVRSSDRFDPVTVGDFQRRLGRPHIRLMPYPEACIYRWRSGIELTFTSFGGPIACKERALQGAKTTKRAWSVKVGIMTYRVGDPRGVFPKRMKSWPYFGHQLASMPFIGRRSPTVGAIFGGRGRTAAFNFFIGGAGD